MSMDTQMNPKARNVSSHGGRGIALALGALLALLITTTAHAEPATAPVPVSAATPATARGYSTRALVGAADTALAAGHPGAAIVELERARLLAPRSTAVARRLSHARALAVVPPVQGGRLARLVRLLSGRAWCYLAAAGLVLGGAGASLLSWGLGRRRHSLELVVGGLAVASLGFLGARQVTPSRADAVVVAASEPARIAPFPAAEPAFPMPEGAAVSVMRGQGDYVLVSAAAGQGWLPRSSVETILP